MGWWLTGGVPSRCKGGAFVLLRQEEQQFSLRFSNFSSSDLIAESRHSYITKSLAQLVQLRMVNPFQQGPCLLF